MQVSIKHQTRMFDIAHRVKYWSDCPQGRQHACVLTINGKYIVSTGYNGVPQGLACLHSFACAEYSRAHMRKCCRALHAEYNACENLLPEVVSAVIVAFVTKKPCAECFERLRKEKVASVYWQEWHKGFIVDQGYKEL